MRRRVVARRDPALHARVVRSVALHYAAGADPSIDRPAHVRAASGAVQVGSRILVVQDDANFFALVDPRAGDVVAVPLPAGAGGRRQFDDVRGNKAGKLDLEAVASFVLPDGSPVVIALGSGSTAQRESVVMLRGLDATGAPDDIVVEVLPVHAFYAQLRAATSFAGSELNVEAAVYLADGRGGHLRLFNRGNGASRHALAPVDATCDVSWTALAAYLATGGTAHPPLPHNIVQYGLGTVRGRVLTFTDATVVADMQGIAGRTLYTATAEASPDATRDGPVSGSALGVIVEEQDAICARWTLLEDEAGRPFDGKVEGIVLHAGDRMRAHVVVDRDEPGAPAELCEVALEGQWFTDA